MLAAVKVQRNATSTFVNLTKPILSVFNVDKGEIVLIETVNENEIKIKRIKE